MPLILVVAAALMGASAQAPAAPTAAPPQPCAAPEYHQFDFWAGRWNVYPTGTDKLIAHSLIEPVYGCGIRENWMPLGKPGGGSLSIYVAEKKGWEQFWIDSQGSRAIFDGGWNGSAMVITGKWGGPLIRMTYSKNADGSVRQFGEQSTDEGKSWAPSFDFTYRPSKAND
jgi:hypothetical protein